MDAFTVLSKTARRSATSSLSALRRPRPRPS